jgi:16S rRNA (cytosine967-C5)-methyltransferase
MSASARAVAVELVRRVADGGAYSNLLLPVLLERSGLDARDRGLATELSYGTLRRMIAIDHALAPLVDRPLESASPSARAVLRVGAYQLLWSRIPAHAAVGETVSLAGPRDRGFVNAVLRRMSRDGAPEPPHGDEGVAVRTGLAPWAVRELRRVTGDDVEEVAAAVAAQAPLTVRTNECRTTTEELERAFRAEGLEPERGRFHAGSLRIRGAAPARLPGYEAGLFAVQDEASAYVVDVLDPRPGELVLDACAGPGGKATDIGCRAGAVVAADLTPQRVTLVRRSAERLRATARLVVQDAARLALREGFDRVLLDAPCSGIGAARRRPELLWRGDRRGLSALARLQVRLSLGAASLLRPGGTFVYSVCTFSRAETDAVCDALSAKAPFLEPLPFRGPDGEELTRARLWPHRHGTDAMFVARFRRV